MRSTFSIMFYVNKSKEKNGKVPIMGRVTANGTIAQFSCKQCVQPVLWDASQNRAKGRSREAKEVNFVLDSIRAKLLALYRQMIEKEIYVSADMIRNAFWGIGKEHDTLLSAFDREIAAFRKRVGKDRAPSSLRSLLVVRRHLADFIRCHRREDWMMGELTEEFIRAFCVYLRDDLKLSQTTAWIYCTPLKRIVSRAHYDGKITRNPFAQFHITPNARPREFLTETELEHIMIHSFHNSVQAFVRDIFIFGCFTGISFIDIKQLTIDQLIEVNGNWWICSTRQKTKTCYQVRLLDIPLKIIFRYAPLRKGEFLFDLCDYWKVNTVLKQIAIECGIRKHLTFHVSRHTFATLALSKGMPIESVSRILGHTKIATTQIYAKITTEKLERDMALLNEQLEETFKSKIM